MSTEVEDLSNYTCSCHKSYTGKKCEVGHFEGEYSNGNLSPCLKDYWNTGIRKDLLVGIWNPLVGISTPLAGIGNPLAGIQNLLVRSISRNPQSTSRNLESTSKNVKFSSWNLESTC